MRRLAVRGAAALAVFTAAFTASAAGATRAADCWLLDEAALSKAQAQGRCRDAFARNAPDAPARPTKAARRAPPRAAPAPTLWSSLQRLLLGDAKPAKGSVGHARRGGIDHLSFGRTEGTPVQR